MSVRVLFLEDDSADFELIVEILRRHGLSLEPTRASSRAEFESAFNSAEFDLILSDYSIPAYGGFEALKFVRSVNSEIPFILISGAISEEQAVEGLKNGATDYIIKQRLHRIGPAIDRALSEVAERRDHKRAEAKLKDVEAQLLRAERIQTIGSLSGGIAHDLNNGLAPIVMAAEILTDEVQTESGRRMLDLVRTSAKRCADMVKQILSFTRGKDLGREVLHTAKVIEDSAAFARETFPRLITIETQVDRNARPFQGNVTQVQQVLMNLLVNARDAIAGQGTISISARNVTFRNKTNPMLEKPATGLFVAIAVKDTGSGITPDVRDRIFEPFFTTKEHDKGTGLGLSTVHSILKSHGGFIEVQSALGKGTTFEVFLPAHAEKSEPEPAAEMSKLPPAHGERLLVIDDESGLLAVLKTTLETMGFKVETASTGIEVLAALEPRETRFDLILTDWVMPHLTGPELLRKIRDSAPEAKIVVVTGSADIDDKTIETFDIFKAVAKPYTTETLLRVIFQALGKAAAAPA